MFSSKKTLFFVAAVFSVISLFAAPKKNAAPDWIIDVRSVYPDADYIAQMGEGSSQTEAQTIALNYIANYFESKVSADSVMNKMVSQSTVNGQSTSSVSTSAVQTVNVQSNVDLFGVKYEFYANEKAKKYYCVAYINRQETWDHFYTKMEAEKKQFDTLYNSASSSEKSEPLLAIRDYTQAYPHMLAVANYIDYAGLILPAKASTYDSDITKASGIPAKLTKLKRNCTFALNVNGDTDERVRATIRDMYSNEGFTVRENSASAKYVMFVTINMNHKVDGKSGNDTVWSVTPTIDIEIDQGDDILFTYSKSLPKVKTFAEDACLKKGVNSVVDTIKETLLTEFYENL